jgi:hypothetical protein
MQNIVQIEMRNDGSQMQPELLCANCVNKIQAMFDYVLENTERRAQQQEQAASHVRQLWEQDPVLLLIEVGGHLLKTHLQKNLAKTSPS